MTSGSMVFRVKRGLPVRTDTPLQNLFQKSSSSFTRAYLYINPQVRSECCVCLPWRISFPLGGRPGLHSLDREPHLARSHGELLESPLNPQHVDAIGIQRILFRHRPDAATGIPNTVVMNTALTVTDDGQPALSQDPDSLPDGGWEELTVVSNHFPARLHENGVGPYYPTQTGFLFSLSDRWGHSGKHFPNSSSTPSSSIFRWQGLDASIRRRGTRRSISYGGRRRDLLDGRGQRHTHRLEHLAACPLHLAPQQETLALLLDFHHLQTIQVR